jgi:hypothetical protein
MEEILPDIFHWTTFHKGIGVKVHSYLLRACRPAVLIDPRVPEEGLQGIAKLAQPRHVFLTNRLHYRHSGRFARASGAQIWAHRAGAQAFGPRRHPVKLFEHGARLPGGIQALKVGALCPEETAFYLKLYGGILALGDAVIREGDRLAFVPDELMGEDPEAVKKGLGRSLSQLLTRRFKHILMAHGSPWLGEGKRALKDFLAEETKRRENK